MKVLLVDDQSGNTELNPAIEARQQPDDLGAAFITGTDLKVDGGLLAMLALTPPEIV
jgi:hypothetical protein